MIKINSLTDLNRAVANALHPEPPLSERWAIQESGCWKWARYRTIVTRNEWGRWEPADFCSDPVASKLLEERLQKCRQVMMWWDDGTWCVDAPPLNYGGPIPRDEAEIHESRLIGLVLVFLRTLKVEFELLEGWDKK